MAESDPRDKPGASGIAVTARRVTVWTSNLLLTAILAIGALTFGRTITGWWSTSSAELHSGPIAALPLPSSTLLEEGDPHTLQFGNLPLTFRRQTFTGDKPAMFAALGNLCTQQVTGAAMADRQPGPFEQQMLDRIRELNPTEINPGRWRLYQLDGPIPMIAVVDDGKQNSRVLSWGVAFPIELESQQWTLFSGAADDGRPTAGDLPELPTPAGASRVMSIATANGGAMVCYSGTGNLPDWMVAFEDWFGDRGWSYRWQGDGTAQHGLFTEPTNGDLVEVAIQGGEPMTAVVIVSASGAGIR